jgi:hypothetical protein
MTFMEAISRSWSPTRHRREPAFKLKLDHKPLYFPSSGEFLFALEGRDSVSTALFEYLAKQPLDKIVKEMKNAARVRKTINGLINRMVGSRKEWAGDLLRELDASCAWQDHHWDEILQLLQRKGPEYGAYQAATLFSYGRYADARWRALKVLIALKSGKMAADELEEEDLNAAVPENDPEATLYILTGSTNGALPADDGLSELSVDETSELGIGAAGLALGLCADEGQREDWSEGLTLQGRDPEEVPEFKEDPELDFPLVADTPLVDGCRNLVQLARKGVSLVRIAPLNEIKVSIPQNGLIAIDIGKNPCCIRTKDRGNSFDFLVERGIGTGEEDRVVDTHSLFPGQNVIGRVEACKVKIASPTVSDKHALIVTHKEESGYVYVKDLTSIEGTLLPLELIVKKVVDESG